MKETNDYTPQLKKSIEWAKQTRWCEYCGTRTPHERFAKSPLENDLLLEVYGVKTVASLVCGWCGNTSLLSEEID